MGRPRIHDARTAAALLDEAEDYLNEVGDRVRAEVDAERARPRGWRRLFRRH